MKVTIKGDERQTGGFVTRISSPLPRHPYLVTFTMRGTEQ